MTAAFSYYTGEGVDPTQHQSYVRKCAEQLTDERRAVLYNGVGSSLPGLKYADDIIPLKYKACMRLAALYHDIGYWIGGTEQHRQACDELFYKTTLKDMSWCLIDLERYVGKAWANVAYFALKHFARRSFEYRDNPITIAELNKLADNKIEARNV